MSASSKARRKLARAFLARGVPLQRGHAYVLHVQHRAECAYPHRSGPCICGANDLDVELHQINPKARA